MVPFRQLLHFIRTLRVPVLMTMTCVALSSVFALPPESDKPAKVQQTQPSTQGSQSRLGKSGDDKQGLPDGSSKKDRWVKIISELKLGERRVGDWSECETYLHGGLRWLNCHFKEVISLKDLRSFMGEPLFVSGPHSSSINYQDQRSFGYYNPKWLKVMNTQVLTPLLGDQTFITFTRPVYTMHLKKMVDCFLVAHQWLEKRQQWVTNPLEVQYRKQQPKMIDLAALKSLYVKSVQSGSPISLQEMFRDPTDRLVATYDSKPGDFSWYYINTALGWWLRRSIDGTSDQFIALLKSVSEAYR